METEGLLKYYQDDVDPYQSSINPDSPNTATFQDIISRKEAFSVAILDSKEH
jgi:hypothetical protein